ncbi:shikimate kinase 1, chloroplastic-like isoform X1 [Juglans microcarpa x Juglans regia]|uniref:shikimate kinase 1, chloroplastic-like isoform X1 n=1 Tax=Juglans microcarpa x Juglans regia TaxID=2249226 RepID=UPI001B7F528B|nr:shikimate kinase 1, chloroplastic-like isoform X1 [Juglans microcarpa x Juglans regia]XP_040997825.1 shikimate kinase 1, chloroplastic-like isoform X1 [Juglans microcarpa x Juglans regia]
MIFEGMGATRGVAPRFSTLIIGSKSIGRKLNVAVVRLNQRDRKECITKKCDFRPNSACARQRLLDFQLSHSCNHSQAVTVLESGNFSSFDEDCLLKNKAQEVASYVNGRSIFLLGMMGSGKTTVGQVLSTALGYSFIDSDAYVEQAMGGTSVAQIFKHYGESFFRDHESEALRKLSSVPRQVVATGGGVVVRHINWKFMRQGISVFLDVPIDALAKRIAKVGTDSRPLLHFDSGDAYTKTFVELFTLTKKRSVAYEDADVTVSLLNLAANLHLDDMSDITPTAVATEALVQIGEFLQEENGRAPRVHP